MPSDDISLVGQNACLGTQAAKSSTERASRGYANYRCFVDGDCAQQRRAASSRSDNTSVSTLTCHPGAQADPCDARPPSTAFDASSSMPLSSFSALGASVPLSTCSGAGFSSSIYSVPGGVAGTPPQRLQACPYPRAFSRSPQPLPQLQLQPPLLPHPQRSHWAQSSVPGFQGSLRAGSSPYSGPALAESDARRTMDGTDPCEVVRRTNAVTWGAARMYNDLEPWVQFLGDGPKEEEEEEELEAALVTVTERVVPAFRGELASSTAAAAGLASCRNSSNVMGDSVSDQGGGMHSRSASAAPSRGSDTLCRSIVPVPAPGPTSSSDPPPPMLPATPAPPAAMRETQSTAAVTDVAIDADGAQPCTADAAVGAITPSADSTGPAPGTSCPGDQPALVPALALCGKASQLAMQSRQLLAPVVPDAPVTTGDSGGDVTAAAAGGAASDRVRPPGVWMQGESSASAVPPPPSPPAAAVAFGATGITVAADPASEPIDADFGYHLKKLGSVDGKPQQMYRRACHRGYLSPGPMVMSDAAAAAISMAAIASATGCGRLDGGAAAIGVAPTGNSARVGWSGLQLLGNTLRARRRLRHHCGGGGGGGFDRAVQQRRRGLQRRVAAGRILWTEAGYGHSRIAPACDGSIGPAVLFSSFGNSNNVDNTRNNGAYDDDNIAVMATMDTDGAQALRYDSFGSGRIGGAGVMSSMGLVATTAGSSLRIATPGQILTFSIAAMAAAAAARQDGTTMPAAAAAAASLRQISLADGDWDSLWTDDDVLVREPLPQARPQSRVQSFGAPSLCDTSGPLLDLPYNWEAAMAALGQEVAPRGSVLPGTPAGDGPRSCPYDASGGRVEEIRTGGAARKAWRRLRTGLGGLLRGITSCYS